MTMIITTASSADGSDSMGVGFSDVAILGVSVAGFCILATTIYSIVIMRLQSRAEFEKTEAAAVDYDDLLEQKDVATLNRAQRRARAKNIMKRQRRIAPEHQHNPEVDANALVANLQQEQQDGNDDATNNQQHLSRKERQKAAREAEKMERQLFQDERRLQQKESLQQAQEKKRVRQQIQSIKAEEERKQKVLDKEQQERAAYEKWKTFLASESERMTVVEFIQLVKEQKTVRLMKLSERFRVPIGKVQARIHELVSTRRVTGIITENHTFIYITQEEMDKVAKFVLESREGSLENLASEMKKLIASS